MYFISLKLQEVMNAIVNAGTERKKKNIEGRYLTSPVATMCSWNRLSRENILPPVM